tara:strand:+ start:286 stop:444 length:159 start_codon:yes stop_codon:yes gene_type:complete
LASPNFALPKATLELTVTDCELDVSVCSDEELPSFFEQDSISPSVNTKKAVM